MHVLHLLAETPEQNVDDLYFLFLTKTDFLILQSDWPIGQSTRPLDASLPYSYISHWFGTNFLHGKEKWPAVETLMTTLLFKALWDTLVKINCAEGSNKTIGFRFSYFLHLQRVRAASKLCEQAMIKGAHIIILTVGKSAVVLFVLATVRYMTSGEQY